MSGTTVDFLLYRTGRHLDRVSRDTLDVAESMGDFSDRLGGLEEDVGCVAERLEMVSVAFSQIVARIGRTEGFRRACREALATDDLEAMVRERDRLVRQFRSGARP